MLVCVAGARVAEWRCHKKTSFSIHAHNINSVLRVRVAFNAHIFIVLFVTGLTVRHHGVFVCIFLEDASVPAKRANDIQFVVVAQSISKQV